MMAHAPGDVGAGSAGEATPLPDTLGRAISAGQVRTLLLLGGTFDPPHRAHVELPARARAELERQAGAGPAWLLYIPAARSPLKTNGPVAGDSDRLEMLRLAIAGVDRAPVWTDEIDRAGAAPGEPSYTIDTVERLAGEVGSCGGGVTLRLLIGTDQAAQFHRWRRPREIIASSEPLVMLRAGAETASSLRAALRRTGFWSEAELAAWERRIVPTTAMDVTSTRVREALRRRSTDPAERGRLDSSLDERVLAYIESRGLYV